tara:strand:- start:1305 stop:1418 length:114 start_codon:yes stop_codon:yes gene_type:complete
VIADPKGEPSEKTGTFLTYKRFPEHDKYKYKIEISKP